MFMHWVESRAFPEASVEKELAQAIGRADTSGQTRPASFLQRAVQARESLLDPPVVLGAGDSATRNLPASGEDPADFDQLVQAIRPQPSLLDIDVVIGVRGPIAPHDLCNGLMVPIVAFDQIYSFDRDSLIKAVPKPEKMTPKQFAPAAEELFPRIMQMTDNAGATDEHRALNYLTMRYPAVYATAAEQFARETLR
jgi:cyclic patellamide precursor peptide PatG